MIRRWISVSALVSLAIACTPPAGAQAAQTRPIGDTRVFAPVPEPGQPAGIAVDGERVLVSTAGLGSQPITEPKLFVYERRSGELARSHTVPRAMSPSGMALFGVAVDASRRAYVVDMNGRIIRIDPLGGSQEPYAMFPGAVAGMSTMPFDLAFDDAGFAYVTDSNLAAIWRVPPGGGEPRLWFQDARLFGYLFGAAGIRIDPSRRYLYFTVAMSQHPATPGAGLVYRLPLVDHPSAAQLEEVFRYPARSFPFGIAFGASGKLYVALGGPSQISVLRSDGGVKMREQRRVPELEGGSASDVPYDTPLALAFDGCGSLLVTNSSAFPPQNPAHMAIFDVFVGDTADPLARPAIEGARAEQQKRRPACGPAR